MALLRETYEGTPLDMTQNLKVTVKDRKTGKVDTIISPKANPWMRGDELNMLNGIKKGVVKSVRNIAVPQCAYSTVIQLRNWLPDAVGGVVWFSMDNPGQSPRVPVFCGITDFPAMYKICGNHRYRDDAALWHYRRANKLAAVRWGAARKVMGKKYSSFRGKRTTGTSICGNTIPKYPSIQRRRSRPCLSHRLYGRLYRRHHPSLGRNGKPILD